MSLRVRLAVVLTVTVLLPLAAAGVVVGVLVPRVAADASTERLEATARAATATLTRQCTTLGLAARSLALDAAPRLAAGDDVPASAAQAAVGSLEGVSAGLLDADGTVLAATGDADLAGLRGASCSQGSTPADRQVETVPVRDGQGRLVGWAVAAVTVDDAAVQQLRGRLGLPAGLVLVADGRVVAADVAGLGSTGLQLDRLAASVPDPPASGLRVGSTDDLRWAVAAGAPAVGGTVVAVEAPRASFLSRAVPVLLLLAAALALAGTWLVARRLTAPLEELTATVDRLGHGDLSTRTTVRGHDEVGRLGAAVNAMADALERSLADADEGRAALAETLERFGEALARTHDLGGLLQTVAEAAATEAGADTCVVYVTDPAVPVGGAPAGGVRLVERAVVDLEVHSPQTRDRLREVAARAVAAAAEVTDRSAPGTSVVALPLLHEAAPGEGCVVLGVIVLAGRRRLEEDQLAAARSLVRPAGTAVHNVIVHEETARMSVTDPLTGLANARSLTDTLTREVERATRFGRPLSVLTVDLDHFKTVNDTWGHAVGDRVLRALADRLRGLVREVDTVARYSGEEFVVLLPETAAAGATEVARRVVEAVRREPLCDAGVAEPVRVTVSVGVAALPEHAGTAQDLLRRAGEGLAAAKAAGRDRWASVDVDSLPT